MRASHVVSFLAALSAGGRARLASPASTIGQHPVIATSTMASHSALGPTNALRLPRLFADGMVVQRNKPVVVWGWARPAGEIMVAFRGHSTRASGAMRA